MEDWSHCFKRFDYDNSGSIDCYEMKHALKMFGYNVSDGFVKTLVQTFDKHGLYTKCISSCFSNIDLQTQKETVQSLLIILFKLVSLFQP